MYVQTEGEWIIPLLLFLEELMSNNGNKTNCSLVKTDYKPPRREDMIYGFNLFNQYLIRKSFFIHAEWQKTSEPARREFDAWNNSLLGGIGRYFSIGGKARGNMIVFYDFLGDKDKPFNQRFRVKFGFMFGGD